MSAERRKQLGKKGGKLAKQRGTAYKFDASTASQAAKKATQTRKQYSAYRAALYLMNKGFTAEELNSLQLSFDEYIYFGGSKTTTARLSELQTRLDKIKDSAPTGHNPGEK